MLKNLICYTLFRDILKSTKKNLKNLLISWKIMPPPPTAFLLEQRIWIILKYGELKSYTHVRRAFRLKYSMQPKKLQSLWAFRKVLMKFEKNGDASSPTPFKKDESKVPLEDVDAIREYFHLYTEAHLREAVRDLTFSLGRI